jgi:hypothetical protein
MRRDTRRRRAAGLGDRVSPLSRRARAKPHGEACRGRYGSSWIPYSGSNPLASIDPQARCHRGHSITRLYNHGVGTARPAHNGPIAVPRNPVGGRTSACCASTEPKGAGQSEHGDADRPHGQPGRKLRTTSAVHGGHEAVGMWLLRRSLRVDAGLVSSVRRNASPSVDRLNVSSGRRTRHSHVVGPASAAGRVGVSRPTRRRPCRPARTGGPRLVDQFLHPGIR